MTGTTPPPSAIRAYLDTSGWTRHPGPFWSRDGRCVDAPDWLAPDLVEEVLAVIARAEGRAAGDVARSVEALAKAKGDPPPDEFEAVRNVAAMLGMDRPAPALGERSTAATELTEGTRIQLARAMYDSIDRCARCKVCEHQIGAAAKVAGEAVRAERERAVAAEARLAEIASHVRDRLNAPGRAGMSRAAAGIILGLAEGSSEEENREH